MNKIWMIVTFVVLMLTAFAFIFDIPIGVVICCVLMLGCCLWRIFAGADMDNEIREKTMETRVYSVIHTHRYGQSTSLVECDHWPTEEELRFKGIVEDYEPDRDGEYIEVIIAPKIERI